jgi:hypothetical protein
MAHGMNTELVSIGLWERIRIRVRVGIGGRIRVRVN